MQLKVNYEEVYQGSIVLKQKALAYDEIIAKIYARMYEMQSVWQGNDNQAFITKLEQFRPQLKRMTQIIEQYSRYLNASAANYQALQEDRIAKARTLA